VVSTVLPADGGVVSTGPATGPDNPVGTTVDSPNGGFVSITEGGSTAGAAPSGYAVLGQVVQITAPPATPADPLVISLELANVLTAGHSLIDVQLVRDGVPLPDCTSTDGSASPDPCVGARVLLPSGNVQITTRTSHASMWALAVAAEVPTASPTPTPTSRSTVTAIATPTPTSTLLPGRGAIEGFALTSLGNGSIVLSWHTGTAADAEAGFRLRRMTIDGETVLPLLGPSTTSATDTLPAGIRHACYVVQAINAAGSVMRTGDIECVATQLAFGAGPMPISINLPQRSLALVTWGDAAGATSYVFLPLGAPNVQILPATTHAAFDNTGGGLRCYIVAARSATSVIGISDGVCGLSL
jgi:hypothetical protein